MRYETKAKDQTVVSTALSNSSILGTFSTGKTSEYSAPCEEKCYVNLCVGSIGVPLNFPHRDRFWDQTLPPSCPDGTPGFGTSTGTWKKTERVELRNRVKKGTHLFLTERRLERKKYILLYYETRLERCELIHGTETERMEHCCFLEHRLNNRALEQSWRNSKHIMVQKLNRRNIVYFPGFKAKS